MAATNLLHTEALAIGYGGRGSLPLLPPTEVSLTAGKLVCLLGPNGAGKTTLLRTLAGLQKPLGGKVFLGDKDLTRLSPREIALGLSVVLTERVASGSSLTAQALVALGRLPYTDWLGRLSPADHQAAQAAMELTGTLPFAGRPLYKLSDGERQKVMIARALAQDTPLILLDEPTAHLDWPNRIEILRLLRHLAHTLGKTLLLSTHELELALQAADEVWLLQPGKPLLTGIPEALVLAGAFADTFDRPGIRFDPASGSFALQQPSRETIGLIGTGAPAYWTARALQRLGYGVQLGSEALTCIRISTEQAPVWQLTRQEGTTIHHSLENLLQTLD